MADKIQIRRDTAANWTSANPTLAQGELGYETDTDKVKVGDGSTAWTSLGYVIDTGGYLIAANNLSDLASASTARTNLGLGTAATTASTDYATAAQGALADSAVQPSDNISGLTNDSGYITDYTVTESDVTAHQAALSITESQISDLGTYLTAADVSGKVDSTGDSMTGALSFGDSVKAQFGASQDLQIFHDGSNSYIIDNGTGPLIIRGESQILLQNTAGTEMITANSAGSVALRYNGSAKIATTSTGATVTGTLNATTDLQINGSSVSTQLDAKASTGKAIAMAIVFGG